MINSISPESTKQVLNRLQEANASFAKLYPGESPARQPVHTVYGGAQIFRADTARKLGATALQIIKDYSPNTSAFAKAVGLKGSKGYHTLLFNRIIEKLKREPVEDFRIDFEDGYGNRPDTEEDGHAISAADEVVRGMRDGTLPQIGRAHV